MWRKLVPIVLAVLFVAGGAVAFGDDPNCNEKSSKKHAAPAAQNGPSVNCQGGAMQGGIWVPNGVTWTCPSYVDNFPSERKCDGPKKKDNHCREFQTTKSVRRTLQACGGGDYACVQTGVQFIPRKVTDTQEWDCVTGAEVTPASLAATGE